MYYSGERWIFTSGFLFSPLSINGTCIEYVHAWKYLGTTITDGERLGFLARPDLMSFFRASNSIINALTGAHEHTLVSLLYSNCVPILTYACAVKQYSAREMSDCNLAMNNVLRKIFVFSQWQSVRYIRELFGVKSLYVLFKEAQDRF